MSKSAENTDWLSASEQQAWFDRFKDHELQGIKFNQFQKFLEETIYSYFARSSSIPCATTSDNIKFNSAIANDYEDSAPKFSYQQEMLLFKVFDLKNDHYIDRDEFTNLCQNWLEKTFCKRCALVVVDVQNDFIDGSLALINGPAGQDGAEVVPVINKLIDRCSFDMIAYTQDWHPPDHIGFYDNLHLRKHVLTKDKTSSPSQEANKEDNDKPTTEKLVNGTGATGVGGNGKAKYKLRRLVSDAKVFDTVLFDEGRIEQKLWPVHCVQNSWGAELHPKLHIVPNAVRILKGTLPHVDAYSAFWDNMRMNETGLRQELLSRKINDVFFCGLALDYCVAASAIDAARAGFTTFVIEDACRGIDEDEILRRKEEMLEDGILIINSDTLNNYLLQIRSCQRTKALDGEETQQDQISTHSYHFDRTLLVDICLKRALALGA